MERETGIKVNMAVVFSLNEHGKVPINNKLIAKIAELIQNEVDK